jgi:hypothetical protein
VHRDVKPANLLFDVRDDSRLPISGSPGSPTIRRAA